MRIAVVYASGSGNTKALTDQIVNRLGGYVKVFDVKDVDVTKLVNFDVLIVGSYTWGDGDLPVRMKKFYERLETVDISHMKTAVFGTGETGYFHYCRAVDMLRDMLFAKSEKLLVTLKVEQMFSESDVPRIDRFAEIVNEYVSSSYFTNVSESKAM